MHNGVLGFFVRGRQRGRIGGVGEIAEPLGVRLAHARESATEVVIYHAGGHFVGANCEHGEGAEPNSGRALVLRRILFVGRVFGRVIPHVRPGNEHYRRNPVLHVGDVIARAVVLVNLDIEGILAAVRRLHRLRGRVAAQRATEAHTFARDVGDVLHHALRDVVEIARKGVRCALQHPEAPAVGNANRFHVEVERANNHRLFFGMRGEIRIGALNFRHPLEVNGALWARQFAFGNQLDVGAANFERQRAARVVVVGALFDHAFVEVATDRHFLRRAAITRNFGVHVLGFARYLNAFGDGADGDLLAAEE